MISKSEAIKQRQARIDKVRAEHSAILYKAYEEINNLHVPTMSKLKVREGINEMLRYLGADSISAKRATKLINK